MDTLVQFGAFLSSHLSPEEYGRRVFDLNVLIEEYRMPGDIAFYLYRPKLTSLIGVHTMTYIVHTYTCIYICTCIYLTCESFFYFVAKIF